MKASLGPVWTAEQIAAGKRFGQAWQDFFARTAGAPPAQRLHELAGHPSPAAIRAKHEASLLGYPNVVGVTEGIEMRAGKPTGAPALVVLVSGKVPRKSLPKASRLPSEIDGVPIDVVEVGPIEALDRPPRGRAKARGTTRRRRKKGEVAGKKR
jgi:hypothetical protein